MVSKEQIDRINELYKKKNEVGLSTKELEEQQTLRRLYIDSFKSSLKSQLENIKVVSPEEYEELKKKEHDEHCKCGCHDHNHNHKIN
jgi:uncharacterized protein YnzC (UPF0291/DUF896 family)